MDASWDYLVGVTGFEQIELLMVNPGLDLERQPARRDLDRPGDGITVVAPWTLPVPADLEPDLVAREGDALALGQDECARAKRPGVPCRRRSRS